MDEVLKQLIQFIIAGSGFIFIMIFFLNFISKGYLLALIQAKASQGKKILMRVKTPIGFYFCMGKYEPGFLTWKGKDKKNRRKDIGADELANFIFHSHGIAEIITNDDGSVMVNKDLNPVLFTNGNDLDNEAGYIRLQHTPRKENNKEKIVLIVSIITLLLLLILFFKVTTLSETINAIQGIGGVI